MTVPIPESRFNYGRTVFSRETHLLSMGLGGVQQETRIGAVTTKAVIPFEGTALFAVSEDGNKYWETDDYADLRIDHIVTS